MSKRTRVCLTARNHHQVVNNSRYLKSGVLLSPFSAAVYYRQLFKAAVTALSGQVDNESIKIVIAPSVAGHSISNQKTFIT